MFTLATLKCSVMCYTHVLVIAVTKTLTRNGPLPNFFDTCCTTVSSLQCQFMRKLSCLAHADHCGQELCTEPLGCLFLLGNNAIIGIRLKTKKLTDKMLPLVRIKPRTSYFKSNTLPSKLIWLLLVILADYLAMLH